ncbi:MAG: uncharacterized protein JWO98_4810 [Frankiales bacterium]|nr:uncharacterized protein [Frankiales bacterium]
MAREIPEAVRAAAGLAATVLDEARRLPETLPGLPVRVLGLAMQLSMKLQQQYAGLVARGDELFTGMRGVDEPGLATFDEDVAPAGAAGTSAFDRVAETIIEVTEDDDAAAADLALDEIAIEELVDEAPGSAGADALADAVLESGDGVAVASEGTDRGRDADGLTEPEVLDQSPAPVVPPEAPAPEVDETEVDDAPVDVIEVDVIAPGGEVDTVDATLTDEAIAVPEPAPAAAGERAGVNSLAAPRTAPVEGYDDWSIAQLRGRLRGYQPVTVAELLAYEEAALAREPYVRMLRNRLEKLDEQAVESSPLAPRGA